MSELQCRQISKHRYPSEYEGWLYGIDVYDENLPGCHIAEIEGRPGVELKLLPEPNFSLHEIASIPLFNGANLAKSGSDQLHQIFIEYQVN